MHKWPWNNREPAGNGSIVPDGNLFPIGERLANLESEIKRLRMEWEDFYDLAYKAMKRSRKREVDADKAALAESPLDAPQDGTDPISAHILNRRRRRNAVLPG